MARHGLKHLSKIGLRLTNKQPHENQTLAALSISYHSCIVLPKIGPGVTTKQPYGNQTLANTDISHNSCIVFFITWYYLSLMSWLAINKLRKIFRKTNISNLLLVLNVSFIENFPYVPNGWPLSANLSDMEIIQKLSNSYYKTLSSKTLDAATVGIL